MSEWIKGVDYPEWGDENYLSTLKGGYLQDNETPANAYRRLASTAAKYLQSLPLEDIEERIYTILWNGWLIPSTPVMANMGTGNALPIACYGSVCEDSITGIWNKVGEIAMMSKLGGGTSIDMSAIRPIGSPIRGGKGGVTDGLIQFLKVFDATINASKQAKTRKGACAIYLDINHKEADSFMRLADQSSGENFCPNLQTGFIISDDFMKSLEHNATNKELFKKLIKTRVKKGFPYLMWKDTANNKKPFNWNTNIPIKASNLCSEIFLSSDKDHSFVCCLSSLNVNRYDEWKDTETVFIASLFLDAVMEDFLINAKHVKELEPAVRFAEKSRALGLGVLGLHSYFQTKEIVYGSLQSQMMSRLIFSKIQAQTIFASKYLGEHLGVPEWCQGSGRRNLTTTCIPPTRSTSLLAGNMSEGCQPYVGNVFANQTAKGTFYQVVPEFEKYLKSIGMYNEEVLKSVDKAKGSCQHLSFIPDEMKAVFRTRFEINQMDLVKLTAVIQEYIEQGISCNLSFRSDAPPKYIYDTHIKAWELGLKSLYYLKSESAIEIDGFNKEELYAGCSACEG